MLGQTDRACPDKLTQLQLLTGNCPVTGRYLEHWTVDSSSMFLWRENPQSRVQWTLKFTARAFEARKGLSSGDFEGEEVHGYLPTPSEVQ